MHIEINARCRRGLRVIEEIPNIPLCRIEGYNGIGKTSAIRLLQICTGMQPFLENSIAWSTFRAQLIGASVKVTELQGAEIIEWNLAPEEWPNRPENLTGSSVGEVRIDGKRASAGDIGELLQVHHLNTAETPVKILTERAEAAGAALDAWYVAEGSQRAAEIDHLLARVIREISACSPAEVRLVNEVAASAKKAAVEVAERAADARSRVGRLEQALQLAENLETVRGITPQMDSKAEQLQDKINQLEHKGEVIDKAIEEAQEREQLNEKAQKSLTTAQRALKRHSNALGRLTSSLEKAAASISIEPRIERVTEDRIVVTRKLEALIKAQPYVSATPLLLAVLNDLVKRLDDAMALDLGAHTIIPEDNRQPGWTVAGLREACRTEVASLSQDDHGTDAERLAADIDRARTRLDRLDQVEELLREVDEVSEKVKRAEENLVAATNALPGESTAHLNDLLSQRNDCDREIRDVRSRLDRVQAERDLLSGGKSELDLMTELDQVCRELDIDHARIRGAVSQARQELNDLTRGAAQAEAKAASSIREADERMEVIMQLIELLAISPELGWLRQAMPRSAHLADLTLNDQLTELEIVKTNLSNARDCLENATVSVRAMGSALKELSVRMRNPSIEERRSSEWTERAGLWLASEGRQWFDDEIMRKALFEGGSDIDLDFNRLTVSWELGGERYERPLSAFSSGEQTFAHTRARVAQLEREVGSSANRLITLDEFGAFLDARYLADLAGYLRDRQARVPSDQILVILPHGALPRSNELGKAQTQRDIELAERGYFAEELSL